MNKDTQDLVESSARNMMIEMEKVAQLAHHIEKDMLKNTDELPTDQILKANMAILAQLSLLQMTTSSTLIHLLNDKGYSINEVKLNS